MMNSLDAKPNKTNISNSYPGRNGQNEIIRIPDMFNILYKFYKIFTPKVSSALIDALNKSFCNSSPKRFSNAITA